MIERSTNEKASAAPVVLVVEDELFLLCDLADCLREAGWVVLEAISADRAMAVCRDGTAVHILITDIQLKGTANGWDIAEHATTRIAFGLVRCGSEKCRGHSAKLLDRRNAELFFAVEVMEEAAFRDTSSRADVVDGAGRVALSPYDVPGCFEQLGARF